MILQAILAASLLGLGTSAFGSCVKDAYWQRPMEGGVVAETKDAHYELVAKPEVLRLYVREHSMSVDIFEVEAKLTLLAGRARQVVDMKPVQGRLEAAGNFEVGPGTRVVAVVTRPGKPATTVRFALK